MKLVRFTALFFLLMLAKLSAACEREEYVVLFNDSVSYSEFIAQTESAGSESPNPFFRRVFKVGLSGKSRMVAAILAFPTTGITGAHRVYLGTAAYIPVVYVGTLGGCLGILPFIDFVVLLVNKDITPYENNRKVFMWMDAPKKPAADPPVAPASK